MAETAFRALLLTAAIAALLALSGIGTVRP
jgi:hypothetical protein